MYSNPASMSCWSVLMLVDALLIHLSFSVRYRACSMLMYIMVFWMFLCPRKFFTWMMSLVSWYSIVAFQCLNVWKDMLCILGFCSFWAVAFRWWSNEVLSPFICCANMVSLLCGSSFIMLSSLSDMCRSRGLLFLDGVMLSVLCSGDRSIHLSFTASDIRMAVSLSVWSSVANRFPHEAISWSISFSVGMNGNLVSIVMCGFVHVSPRYFRSEA